MNHFYIVSTSSHDEYSYGITDLPFETFTIGKTVNLFLPCYNHQEVFQKIQKLNQDPISDPSSCVLLSSIIHCDLRKLIKTSIKKIQHLPPNIIDPSGTQDISENKISQDISENKPTTPTHDRMKIFNDLTLKIFEESKNVNQILTKVQTFKSNVTKMNQTLDSLKRFRNITGMSQVIQSERPRAKDPTPTVQATPRGQADHLTINECRTWIRNKTTNPRTGRRIEENGPTYKKFESMAKIYKLL